MSTTPEQPEYEFLLFYRYRNRYESITAVYHKGCEFSSCCEWWVSVRIKLNLHIMPPSPNFGPDALPHRKVLQEFFKAIDLDKLELLRDTVTKITFEPASSTENPIFIPIREGCDNKKNPYIESLSSMTYKIEEDESRIQWPPFDQVQIPDIPVFDLENDFENFLFLNLSVMKVQIGEKIYAYKAIERLYYEPRDTQNVLAEMTALAKYRGYPNIAQIVGLVKSDDPYTTDRNGPMPAVLTGFLCEYYPGGTLHDMMNNPEAWKKVDESLIMKWAIQIGTALHAMHKNGCTHIGVKPHNIMIDGNQDAVLIDIGGTGGFKLQWEFGSFITIMKNSFALAEDPDAVLEDIGGRIEFDRNWVPLHITNRFQIWSPSHNLAALPFQQRVALDCWTYGKLLSVMVPDTGPLNTLERVANVLMMIDPEAQNSSSNCSLSDSLAILNNKRDMEN
ncbi:hypothetical protein N7493_011467 [Penicillium malachiteum]|uniref:Protein kinase domain-containing protein n=1 Tax=Penicillium malachiteum TaxID=1324776 RepID=A0AAD6HAU2_9EURO|nr:hypothetical protein N7493_011467 [Penicillium malachiteum]